MEEIPCSSTKLQCKYIILDRSQRFGRQERFVGEAQNC
jgi:hypothetical protein